MAALPEPIKSLRAAIEKLAERVKKIENTSPFSGTGLSIPEPGTTQVTGNLWVTGDFTADGKISNDALTSPVSPDTADRRVSNFGVTGGAYTLLGSVTKTVPDGFGRLLVSASGWMFARNPNTTGGVDGTGTDAIFCFVRVSGSDGDSDSTPYGQGISGFGGFTTATSGVSDLKVGLSGTVTFKIYGASSVQNLATDAQNSATLSATLLWLR